MTGHDDILAMRRNGEKPAYVWLTDHAKAIPTLCTVRIQPGDVPEQLDLRFLVGVIALVEGENPARVERLSTACRPFARRVIATTSHGRTVDRITDTEDTLTWPN